MVELACPWCEQVIELEVESPVDAQTCPECLTTWSYEKQAPAVPLAA